MTLFQSCVKILKRRSFRINSKQAISFGQTVNRSCSSSLLLKGGNSSSILLQHIGSDRQISTGAAQKPRNETAQRYNPSAGSLEPSFFAIPFFSTIYTAKCIHTSWMLSGVLCAFYVLCFFSPLQGKEVFVQALDFCH